MMLDASARGDIKRKTEDEAYNLIESMAANEQETHNERGATTQNRGILHLPAYDALLAQNQLLNQKIDNLSKILAQLSKEIRNISQAQQLFDFCGGDHINGNYSQGWKNHPSIGQNQSNPSGQTRGLFNNRPQQPPLWQQVASLTEQVRNLDDKFDKFLKVYDSHFKSHEANFRTLEMQISQLSKRVDVIEKNQFRVNTDVKPKEECKMVVSMHERGVEKEIIEIESIEVLHQVLIYSKRIKYYLGEVIDLEEEEETEKQEVCTRPKKRKHPLKMKDLGSLTISCTIGDVFVGRVMLDSRSNINMMPLFYLKKIGGLTLKPSNLSMIVADGSSKRPIGMVEDVVICVEHLEFLVDFVVMDMESNERIPLILGRPFMKIAKVIISVYDRRIMLKDQENVLIYNGFEEKLTRIQKRVKYRASRRDVVVGGSKGAHNDNCNILQVPKEEDVDKGGIIDSKDAPFQPGSKRSGDGAAEAPAMDEDDKEDDDFEDVEAKDDEDSDDNMG
ncbi:uncharacterized protein LOC106753178 [Vigna radiata var. radiata]|uniref:Uncharacterized protein LOC106753178 n=1 Tax=Vigna radiata var. radiata TaxID=3916 RepID=A0A1S3T9L8_VIGRR|nr:uncharacterized protein LOC106753178 [Vigna radiata var. radiata]